MQDLNQIIENNTKATLAHIPKERAAGKWVIARYTGVNFAGYETFDTRDAVDNAARKHVNIGDSFIVYNPTVDLSANMIP